MDASHAALSVRSIEAPSSVPAWTPRLTPTTELAPDALNPTESITTENRIAARLAEQIGPAQFERFFGGGRNLRLAGAGLEIDAPSGFVAGLLDRRFRDLLSDAAKVETGFERIEIKFLVAGKNADHASSPKPRQVTRRLAPVGLPSERFVLDDFVPGPGNALALDAARRLVESRPRADASRTHGAGSSILTIFGPCGIGKTHLLHATAALLKTRDPAATIRVTTAETFVGDFVSSIRAAGKGTSNRNGRPDTFRREHRSADLLCIDDLAALADKPATQTELLHTIDAVTSRGGRIFVTLPEHPRRVRGLSDALISRLLGGLVAGIESPDREHRTLLTRAIGLRHGLAFDDSACGFIADLACKSSLPLSSDRAPAAAPHPSVREIEGIIIKIEAVRRLLGDLGAPASHNRVGVLGVQRALEAAGVRVPRAPGGPRPSASGPSSGPGGGVRPPIRLSAIIETVCAHTGVTAAEISGNGRRPDIVNARSLCGYLARALTKLSFPEIAQGLGRPNHSTIITACRRVAAGIAQNQRVPLAQGRGEASLAALADHLSQSLRG